LTLSMPMPIGYDVLMESKAMYKSLLTLIIAMTLTGLWILPAAADSACTPANSTAILESEPNDVFADPNAFVDIPTPSSGKCVVIYGSISQGAEFDTYRLASAEPVYFISSNHDQDNTLSLLISVPSLGTTVNPTCNPLGCQVSLAQVAGRAVDFIITAPNPGFYTLTLRQ